MFHAHHKCWIEMSERRADDSVVFAGNGEMADLVRRHDWSRSALGPIDGWSESLKVTVNLLLAADTQIVLFCGPEFVAIYNDAYAPTIGNKHPRALGRPAREGWAELWDDLGPLLSGVLETGNTFSAKSRPFYLERSDVGETVYFDISYSAVRSSNGKIEAVLCIVNETTDQVRAEKRLRESEERFRALVNASSDVVYQMSPDWQEMRQLDGRGFLMDMSGPTIRWLDEYIFPEDQPQIIARIDQAIERRDTFEMEHRVRTADGAVGWTFSRAIPIIDEQGAIREWFGMAGDITVRRRSEEAIRESEDRFQMALSAGGGIGTWDWDVPSDRVYADARFAELYGVDPLRAREGTPIAAFFTGIHPDDVVRVREEVGKGLETGEPFHSEYRLPQRDGQDRWVVAQGRCVLSSDGKPLRFSGLSFDITDRKKAEIRREALVRLTDEIRDLDDPDALSFAASTILGEALNVSRASYGTIDPVAETLTVERDWLAPGVESLAGTLNLRDYGSFIDSLKRGEFIAIADVDQDERTASAAEALRNRSAAAFVNVPVIERGQLVAVLFLNNAKIRNWASEDLALVQEVAERTRTATERLKAVDALRQANATLEANVKMRTAELEAAGEALRQSQKMEAIGQLTGGIAHDFNNLLAGISGSLELLDKRLSEGRLQGVGRYINVAQESTRRAASLTQRLLAFARRQTLDPKVIDANRTIAGMADLLTRSVGPDVHVEVVQASGLWGARLDPSQLENAILNLCINARDAMAPNGGRITIETANKWLDDRAARERDLPAGQYVSVSVSDTGTGMSADIIAKIFDPFFTTKPLGRGTGLGLSMIYGFVRQSGGQVRVYSEEGKGTTMTLYFPRFVGELSAEERPEDAAFDRGDGETVLVIDDEPAIRMVIGEVLAEIGYRVIEAPDGPSGLRIVQAGGRIDLLITDVGLPNGLNGRQVADAARSINPKLKILFITGFAENAAVGNGHLDAGMSVITKPFSNVALVNKVRQIIDG
jgi:PAS domain S-box-containing protein